jgi:peptidoglycan biosynthesis protein MviN/MurJ (putative lipid II flippase)
MKYYKWIGIAVCILLVVACFLPWTYHADIKEYFNGFYSRNYYGKPGKVIIFFAIISVILVLIKKIWAKRTHLFVAGLLVAYVIRVYIVFTTCYFAYCPERQYGLYLLIAATLGVLITALFPDLKIENKEKGEQ